MSRGKSNTYIIDVKYIPNRKNKNYETSLPNKINKPLNSFVLTNTNNKWETLPRRKRPMNNYTLMANLHRNNLISSAKTIERVKLKRFGKDRADTLVIIFTKYMQQYMHAYYRLRFDSILSKISRHQDLLSEKLFNRVLNAMFDVLLPEYRKVVITKMKRDGIL